MSPLYKIILHHPLLSGVATGCLLALAVLVLIGGGAP